MSEDFRLGIHVTKKSLVLDDKTESDLHLAIERDLSALELNSAQVFTHGPQSMNMNKISIEEIKTKTLEYDITVHSPYVASSIFKKYKDKSFVDIIANQLLTASKIGAWCYVLHITKFNKRTILDAMEVLKPYALKYKVMIGLEMVASKADDNTTYETPEKINSLIEMLGPDEKYYGIVIDTAHVWGAGVDIKDYQVMKKYLSDIKYKGKICMFHLNGSSANIGSGKDKHEIVFGPSDLIWSKVAPDKSGVRAVIEYAAKNNILVICEIKRDTEENIRKGIKIIKSFI